MSSRESAGDAESITSATRLRHDEDDIQVDDSLNMTPVATQPKDSAAGDGVGVQERRPSRFEVVPASGGSAANLETGELTVTAGKKRALSKSRNFRFWSRSLGIFETRQSPSII
jgi:hypothetical protein